MLFDKKNTPEEVVVSAERCVAHIKHRYKFDLDYSIDTLSVVDSFIRDILAEEGDGEAPPAGDERRTQLIHLLGPSIGAYFGVVLSKNFPTRWRLKSEKAYEWFIEFETVPLRFNPVVAASEALFEENIDSWGPAMLTEAEETPHLIERLKAAPPIPEDEFYSLTTRLEVLQIAVEYLLSRKEQKDPPAPAVYTRDYYNTTFDLFEPSS